MRIQNQLIAIQNILKEIDLSSEEVLSSDLIYYLCEIDKRYKELCSPKEYQEGLEKEFFIEGVLWHKVSMILRRINNNMFEDQYDDEWVGDDYNEEDWVDWGKNEYPEIED